MFITFNTHHSYTFSPTMPVYSTTMSPLKKFCTSNSRSMKRSIVSGSRSEVANKTQIQPVYNFTILKRPQRITLHPNNASPKESLCDERLPIQHSTLKPLSNTGSASNFQGPVSVHPLANSIRKSAHKSRDENKYAIEMSLLGNIPWIGAEHVFENEEVSRDDVSVTSVSWAMTTTDPYVEDAAREWFRSSSFSKTRTYTHGSISAKAIYDRRERSMRGYHPLCETVKKNVVTYPYL